MIKQAGKSGAPVFNSGTKKSNQPQFYKRSKTNLGLFHQSLAAKASKAANTVMILMLLCAVNLDL